MEQVFKHVTCFDGVIHELSGRNLERVGMEITVRCDPETFVDLRGFLPRENTVDEFRIFGKLPSACPPELRIHQTRIQVECGFGMIGVQKFDETEIGFDSVIPAAGDLHHDRYSRLF